MIETTSPIVFNLVSAVLTGVLLIVGAILMVVRRPHHGRAAVIGTIGCLLLLIQVIFNALMGFLLNQLSDLLGMTAFTITSLINLILGVSGTGLLIWAVVARRDPRQPAAPQGPGWQQPPFQQPPGWQAPPRPPQG
ncbi:hypothetical protein [Nonomuraea basaltis]|uniref:hypothetical protein n=1 Tax=Nonomuraea basaltis TaxID=2495887 RepID=UPI00110C4E75|nr:hypothetical protein [Nonomuraea basaltis]TMR94398.1 hypothetical protein EJK15_34045 [Nonomuraea basaltis]